MRIEEGSGSPEDWRTESEVRAFTLAPFLSRGPVLRAKKAKRQSDPKRRQKSQEIVEGMIPVSDAENRTEELSKLGKTFLPPPNLPKN